MNSEVESGVPVEPTAAPEENAQNAENANNEQNASNEESPKNEENANRIEFETFDDMGLRDEVKRALTEMGFVVPMPVQRAVWARMMAGKDVMVQSRTGSGKTAAFGIPLAQGLVAADGGVQALVLAPTRELALQVATECGKIAQYVGLTVVPVYGGAPMGKQIEALKAGAQMVSGTPGRVLDHLRRGTLKLDGLKVLILDEADEMLSMGFYEEITEIIKRCPPTENRQTVLFSATIPEEIERIGSRYMRQPEKIQLSADYVGVHEISHAYYLVSGMGRARDLVRVLEAERPESAIIFCNTREDTALVADFLRKNGMDAEAISSDLTQKDRERVMGRMKEKNLHYLVATDIAARGIDISDLTHVINYTFPESAEVYVHRTGRTGRAGKSGIAISLVSPRELGNFYMLKLTYKIRPEERPLPSEEQSKTVRESAKIDELRRRLGEHEPGQDWRSLARRLWSAEDGEKLVARLIEERLASAAARPQPAPAPARESVEPRRESVEPRRESSEPRRESSDRERGDRDRGERDRDRPSRRRREDSRRDRPQRSEAKAASRGTPPPSAEGRSSSPVQGTIDTSDGREFWEAWVDSKNPEPEPAPVPEGEERIERPRRERIELEPGQVRLYLNLGRRDGVDEAQVSALLAEKGVTVDKLELHNSHTYLITAEANEAPIVDALRGTKHGERDLVVERAKK